jgi:F0F1-type ATP synthase membrane subunit c/vacuolar-type H+-ATPase subunit K
VESRRRFLRDSLALGAGAAGVALTAGTAAAAVVEETPQQPEPAQKKGYRLTQHIADYYRTAGL